MTTDPEVAKKYDMIEESEYWDAEADELDGVEPTTDRADDSSESG